MTISDNILDREHDKFKDVAGETAVRVAIVEGGGGGGGGGTDQTYLADAPSAGRAGESQLVAGYYKDAPVEFSDGDQVAIQTDKYGKLLNASNYKSFAGSGASEHTTMVGGKYQAFPTLWDDGDQTWLAMDENGRARVFARSEKFENQEYVSPYEETGMHIGGFGEDDKFNLSKVSNAGELYVTGSIGISNQIESYPDADFFSPTSTFTINSNILQTTSNNTLAINCLNYKSLSFSLTAAASTTAVTVVFEGSNDNANFVNVHAFDRANPLNAPVTSYVVAASSTRYFECPIYFKHFRARITTAIVAGSMTTRTTMSRVPFVPSHQSVGTVNSVSAVSTVTSITGANLANATATVIGVSAITTSANTGGQQLGNCASFQLYINVTAVSGTNPTYDVKIQYSSDNTNWKDLYTFETITAAGYFTTPLLFKEFTHYRLVQVVGGTAPSFTRNVVIMTQQIQTARIFSFLDKTINPNASSNTPTYQVEGTRLITVTQASAAGATVNPVLTLQVSEDAVNWINTSCTLTCAPSTNSMNTLDVGAGVRYARLATTTNGTSAVLRFVTIKAKE